MCTVQYIAWGETIVLKSKNKNKSMKTKEVRMSQVTHSGHEVPEAATAGKCCSSPEGCIGEDPEDHH